MYFAQPESFPSGHYVHMPPHNTMGPQFSPYASPQQHWSPYAGSQQPSGLPNTAYSYVPPRKNRRRRRQQAVTSRELRHNNLVQQQKLEIVRMVSGISGRPTTLPSLPFQQRYTPVTRGEVFGPGYRRPMPGYS